jgi:hypothetical protein
VVGVKNLGGACKKNGVSKTSKKQQDAAAEHAIHTTIHPPACPTVAWEKWEIMPCPGVQALFNELSLSAFH